MFLKKTLWIFLTISLNLYAGIADEAVESYIKKDYQRALKLSTYLCENGNLRGCNILGNLYAFGLSVPKNYIKAREFYKKSCDGGNAEGCFYLGATYEVTSTEQDFDRAKKLYKKSCDGGFMKACASLGLAVAFHPYTEKDYQMALYGLKKACNSTDFAKMSCFDLFRLYASKKEMSTAKMYAQKSCKAGNDQACGVIKVWDVLYRK